ncbi:glycosyltransferase involved in cell wall biosynthesis [Agrobacterium vitis]|nr:glycosyltransferase involved in cell wall biosynthesis [Agrobacterium vitis]MBE1438150.1 glycosyltransferase involved in cell wall biosynthesis [Agrobacterium vitis]
MLSVIIECFDQESELAQTLTTLVAGAVQGIVADVVVLDNGSSDGTSKLADAAGCRFYVHWDLRDVLANARGEWVLLVEPGARPTQGWIDEIAEYIALNQKPARFSPSRYHRRPLFKRLGRRGPPLEQGFLLPKHQALSIATTGMKLVDLVAGLKGHALSSEMVPAWAARPARA